MKRLLSLLVLLYVAGISRSTAQLASFNFSKSSNAVSGWTNVHGDPSVSILTATAGGVTISSVSTANWSAWGGACAYDGYGSTAVNGFFPARVLLDDWLQSNGSNSNLALYNSAVPQLQLSGLNKDSTYIIRMSASSHYNSGYTQYTVSGITVFGTQLLNCQDNSAQGVTFLHVQPDVNGIINVYVNGSATDPVPLISGLQIYQGNAGLGAPAVTMTSPVNGAKLSEGGDVVIEATAYEVGASISKVEFYADTVKIGEVDHAPYNLTWNNPDPGNYQIMVKATDSAGSINTAIANIAIESLNYFWSTTGNIATGGDTSFVGTVDSNRLAFRTRNIERMTILPTGNIGIGTKTPRAALDVVDTITGVLLPRLTTTQRNGIASGNLLNGLLLYNTDSSAFQYYNGSAWNSVGSGGSGPAGRWSFANGTAYDSVDNIAIGTNNPQGYKLAVNGTGIFTKIIAKPQASWPDYVFDKGYQLPSLEELAQYVRKNHHLPDVTTESEIMQKGIDLGAEQTALLKKVEELTLYLIHENQALTDQTKQLADQNKQLADQNKQLNDQNARLEAQQKQIDELKAMIQATHKP